MKKTLLLGLLICVLLITSWILVTDDLIPTPNPTPEYLAMEKYYLPYTRVGEDMVNYWTKKDCNFEVFIDFKSIMLEELNSFRAEKNLPGLHLNEELNKAALGHAVDMIYNDYYSHISLSDTTPANRVVSSGYSFKHLYEILNRREAISTQFVINSETIARDSIISWANSDTHYEPLVNSEVIDLGTAAVCRSNEIDNTPQQICVAVAEIAFPY